jgi:hypothetical protein
MNSITRQYIFGLIFFAVGVYHLWVGDYLEATLYCLAGLAFVVNTLTAEPKLVEYKKVLVVLSWVLIIATVVVFLYLLQFKLL